MRLAPTCTLLVVFVCSGLSGRAQAQGEADVREVFERVQKATLIFANQRVSARTYLEEKTFSDRPIPPEMRADVLAARDRIQNLRVEVVAGGQPGVSYDAQRNMLKVSQGTLDRLRARTQGMNEGRRKVVIKDALAALMARQTQPLLHTDPKWTRMTHVTSVLDQVSPSARLAEIHATGKDASTLIETAARGGPAPRASALSGLSGETPLAREMKTLSEGLRAKLGFTVEVAPGASGVEVDAQRLKLSVGRETLNAIEAKALTQPNPEIYRRGALAELLGGVADDVRYAEGDRYHWDRYYLAGTVQRLLRGETLPGLKLKAPRSDWRDITATARRAVQSMNMEREIVNRGLVVVESATPEIRYDGKLRKIVVTTGLLSEIDAEVRGRPDARALARQIFAELTHRVSTHVAGFGDITPRGLFEKGRVKLAEEGLRSAKPADYYSRTKDFPHSKVAEKIRADVARYRPATVPYAPIPRTSYGEVLEHRVELPTKVYENREAYEIERLAILRAQNRLPNGNLDWNRIARSGVLREAGGLGHFALALFLKELAVVAQTGDRERIEAFFDGLTSIGFYKHYGLFALGARAGEVAYGRFLQRHVKPVFVNGILRQNVVLATGLALPQLVDGNFSGKAFAITLGSLGLSSAAVSGAISSLKWVKNLRTAKRATTALAAGRLARVGGWVYTAAELAVVLYVAEELEERIHTYLDQRAAREAMADATGAFLGAISQEGLTAQEADAAARAFREAGGSYRDFLYRPLLASDAELAGKLQKLARRAKLAQDRTDETVSRLNRLPALRRRLLQRGESLEDYAKRRTAGAHAEVGQEIDEALRGYQAERAGQFEAVYKGARRKGGLLDGVSDSAWIVGGARPGAKGDPYRGRTDVIARRGRRSAKRGFVNTFSERQTRNRLQSYEDEAALLDLAATSLRSRGQAEEAGAIARVATMTRETGRRDADLVARFSSEGILGALKQGKKR